ncbi:MAG: molybdate ABC transporter permease subunit [Bryobacteraceae bacterium]
MPIDWFPLWLSLRVAALATVKSCVVGIWIAWLLARRDFRGKAALEAAIELPLLLPPTVLGYYLLVLVGNSTPLGRLYEAAFGAPLLFTWRAAVLAAFLYAAPLLVRSARAAFEKIDTTYELAARAMGASGWRVFWQVHLPMVRGPILAAAVLAFARSMADFGITIMIAGNLPGRTQTLSVAVYDAAQKGNGAMARAMVVVISVIAVGALFVAGRLQRRQAAG